MKLKSKEEREKYDLAKQNMSQENITGYREAIKVFESLGNYKDSIDRIEECKEMIQRLEMEAEVERRKAEAKRKEEERKQNEQRQIAKRREKIIKPISLIVFVILPIILAIIHINNLKQIDAFSQVFKNCWGEWILFIVWSATCGFCDTYLSADVSDGNCFYPVVFGVIAMVILGAIFMDVFFILRLIMAIIRWVIPAVVGFGVCLILWGISTDKRKRAEKK